MTLMTGLGIMFVTGLLWAEYRAVERPRWLFKPLSSVAFLGVAMLAGPDTTYGQLIFLGLLLGAAGDVFLLSKAQVWFLAGLVSFLGGHIAYVVAFAQLTTLTDIGAEIIILPILLSGTVFFALRGYFGSLLIPVMAYFVVITLMLIVAWGAFSPGERLTTLAVIGATAFYFSDLAVALDRFVQPAWNNAYWGLPLYYGGQFALAWSIAYA
ncbi:MAG: lysoplasmalogenase [Anaerolineales bacterium]